jgi:Fic/DOC family N-terminal
MPFEPDHSYDLPLLPPKAELEKEAVLRKAITANKALAELKRAGELIPNQGVLSNAIVLQEAKAWFDTESAVPGTTTCAGAAICLWNERIAGICRKKPRFWTYPKT